MALYVHSENKSFFQMIYYVWLLLSLQMCQIILNHPVSYIYIFVYMYTLFRYHLEQTEQL